jgi:hypothetical protein
MTQLHRTRVGVDERHHRLQGDEEPEHQGAVDSVGQVSLGSWKNASYGVSGGQLTTLAYRSGIAALQVPGLTAKHQKSSGSHRTLSVPPDVRHAFLPRVAAC